MYMMPEGPVLVDESDLEGTIDYKKVFKNATKLDITLKPEHDNDKVENYHLF